MSDHAIIGLAAIKGVVMSIILITVLSPTFIQGLITAVLSACVSGAFLLISTHMNSKRTDRKVEEIKETVRERSDVS